MYFENRNDSCVPINIRKHREMHHLVTVAITLSHLWHQRHILEAFFQLFSLASSGSYGIRYGSTRTLYTKFKKKEAIFLVSIVFSFQEGTHRNPGFIRFNKLDKASNVVTPSMSQYINLLTTSFQCLIIFAHVELHAIRERKHCHSRLRD